ncbi:hypothetical protein GOBAR_DD07162 [Gossypium barbadense]|nr:hypothetical protein GOBAR_DD07162 [Gossypium barbadense]
MKFIGCFLVFLAILGIALLNVAEGAGECGRSSPDREAWKLAPYSNAPVSSSCCKQVKKIGQNPRCLCAVMLSNTAKSSGIKPEIAITIPKRCNIADRPVGYQCGGIYIFLCNKHYLQIFQVLSLVSLHLHHLKLVCFFFGVLQNTLCLEHEG